MSVYYLLLLSFSLSAQFDNTTKKVGFEPIDRVVSDPAGLEVPKSPIPGLTNQQNRFEIKNDTSTYAWYR